MTRSFHRQHTRFYTSLSQAADAIIKAVAFGSAPMDIYTLLSVMAVPAATPIRTVRINECCSPRYYVLMCTQLKIHFITLFRQRTHSSVTIPVLGRRSMLGVFAILGSIRSIR